MKKKVNETYRNVLMYARNKMKTATKVRLTPFAQLISSVL